MPLVENITDTFAGTVLDVQWDVSSGTVAADGELELACVATYSSVSTGDGDWDLGGSSVHVALTQVPGAGAGTTQAMLELVDSTLAAPVGSLQVGFQGGTCRGVYVTAGPTFNNAFNLPYDPQDHRWLRIAESGGDLTFATSADGVTWTTRATVDTGDLAGGLDSFDVRLFSGFFGAETDPGSARFDHLNVLSQAIDVEGVAVGVAVGVPTVAADQEVDLDGVGVPVAVGAPTLHELFDQEVHVDGLVVPGTVGAPVITFVLDPPPSLPPAPVGAQPGQYVFRGVRFGLATPYAVVRREGLLDKPGVRVSDRARLRRHGSLPGEDFLEPRTVRFEIVVTGGTVQGYQDNLAALMAALSVVGDEEPLVFRAQVVAGGGERFIAARPRRVATTEDGPTWARVLAEFDATDPRIYHAERTERTVPADATHGGVRFPLVFPLVLGTTAVSGRFTVRNNGNFATPVRFVITGPCALPVIRNTRTGQALAFDVQLGNGETLVVSSDTRTVLRNGNTNAYSSLVSDSDWFDLDPGETGLHFSTADQTGTLRATFRSAWIT